MALALPNTGMAVAIDIGETRNIHPKNKQDVGWRLAQWALGTTYKKDLVISGPLYKRSKIDGAKIICEFDHISGGLIAKGAKLKHFSIAGQNKVFVWADAIIQGNKIFVSSEKVKKPVAVRYAWANNPEKCNLYNKEGLPASPFRTDNWPGVTINNK